MKNRISSMALGIALLGTPSLAAAEPYIAFSGGLSLPEDSPNRGQTTATIPASASFPAIPADTPVDWTTEFDNGYNISAFIGYRFDNGFRVEGEVNYARSSIDTHRDVTVGGTNIDAIDASVLTRGPALGATVGAVVDSGIGSQSSYGGFVNAYYDFNQDGAFQPYVGGGVGLQRVRFDYRPSNVDVGQGSETNFAWQLMAGATYRLSDSFEVFGQYNYRNAGRTTLALDLLPADLSARSRQSILSAGVRIPLGGN
ncbi:MAG: outer membrane beta-barrel protein [Erythrobacteraceae bacterium]|jgi:opacity protein-like surface antigen|nr:outer membrane beta-barrel protein [Erythrobacteraceae bacterium]